MSAKRTSSSAKSEKNPEGEEEEAGEEGEEEMSTRLAGGRASIDRRSAQRGSASEMPAASGFAPVALQAVGWPVGVGEGGSKGEGWESGVWRGEVVVVIVLAASVLVMAVGGSNSMSLMVDGKSLVDMGDTGTLGHGGGGTGGGDKGGVGGDGAQKAASPLSSSNKEAGVRQDSRGASVWLGQAWTAW